MTSLGKGYEIWVIFRSRFPAKRDVIPAFAACIVPIYSWLILAFLETLPSWLLFLSPWELIGLFAYSQLLALLESIAILLFTLFLGAVLPARFFRDKFVAQGSTAALLTVIWAIVLRQAGVAAWSLKTFFLWLVVFFTSIGVASALIYRFERLEKLLAGFFDRLSVLLYIYIPMTLFSIAVVFVRNIQGAFG